MQLIVDELYSTTAQQITVGPKDIQLYAIRPHLIRYQQPTGSLQIQILDQVGRLVDSSETIAISAIGSGNYWHGYQRFLITTELKANSVYQIALVASGGYLFSETAYIGCCLDFDLRKVPATYSPNTGINSALDLEIWDTEEFRRAG